MRSLQGDFEVGLSELRKLTGTDFSALAWADDLDPSIRWKYASGNRNDRYKRIFLRNGKGIPGKVIRTGRVMVVDSFSKGNEQDPSGDALFLAEGLRSFICAPLTENDRVIGVILTGCRSDRYYENDVIELVRNFAEQAAVMIQTKTVYHNESFPTASVYHSKDHFDEY